MSFNIRIGETIIATEEGETFLDVAVQAVEVEDAPYWDSFGDGVQDLSGKTNSRYPGYSSMYSFCRRTGLTDLFFNEEEDKGLLVPHPGIKRILPRHMAQIKSARMAYQREFPDVIPGWLDPKEAGEVPAIRAANLAKLIWYEFWFVWALKSCKIPAIANS